MSVLKSSSDSILHELIFNQYQMVLAAAAVVASAVGYSPMPLILWLGAELVFLPILDNGPLRRFFMRRSRARDAQEAQARRERLVLSLESTRARRFRQLEGMCEEIETNYEGLSGISNIYLQEQREKLYAVLNGCLQRLIAVQKYDEIMSRKDASRLDGEITRLEKEIQNSKVTERVRSALKKTLDLKRTLLESQQRADETRKILSAEFDSLAAFLELIHQKSVSIRDPQDISSQLDAILRQVETTDRSIRDMESILSAGSDPLMASADPIPAIGGGHAPSHELRRIRNM
mgnify:CR=1 FL=1